jgi:hypothetical protein
VEFGCRVGRVLALGSLDMRDSSHWFSSRIEAEPFVQSYDREVIQLKLVEESVEE